MVEVTIPPEILEQIAEQLNAQERTHAAALQRFTEERAAEAATAQARMDELQRALTSLLTARATSPAPVPVPSSSSNRLKLRAPTPFDGTKSRCEEFLTQCDMHFQVNPDQFETDTKKIYWLASHTQDEAHRYVHALLKNKDSTILKNFDAFRTAFRATFGDPLRDEVAEDNLWDLKQTTTVSRYITAFHQCTVHTTFDQAALMSRFRHGLKKDVRVELAKLPKRAKPNTLADMMEMSARIDNQLHSQSGNSNRSSLDNYQPSANVHDPDAMVIGAAQTDRRPRPAPIKKFQRLTEAQKEHRRNNGLCMYCGEAGHNAQICPKKRAPFSRNDRARPARRLAAAMTEEVIPSEESEEDDIDVTFTMGPPKNE